MKIKTFLARTFAGLVAQVQVWAATIPNLQVVSITDHERHSSRDEDIVLRITYEDSSSIPLSVEVHGWQATSLASAEDQLNEHLSSTGNQVLQLHDLSRRLRRGAFARRLLTFSLVTADNPNGIGLKGVALIAEMKDWAFMGETKLCDIIDANNDVVATGVPVTNVSTTNEWAYGVRGYIVPDANGNYFGVPNRPALWAPSDISGLGVWYDPYRADHVVIDGNNRYEKFLDLSGNNNDAEQPIAGERMFVDSFAGKNGARSSGPSDWMPIPSVIGDLQQPFTAMGMHQPLAFFSSGILGFGNVDVSLSPTPGPAVSILTQGTAPGNDGEFRLFYPYSGSTSQTFPSLPVSETGPRVYGLSTAGGPSSLAQKPWQNGVTATVTLSVSMQAVADDNNAMGRMLANRANGGSGLFGEHCVYTRELDTEERQKLEGYLAWRSGAQQLASVLGPSHPYANGAPTS